jgi:hypothetical protein
MATSPDVETLERETAEARARLANTLDRLTSPTTAQAVKQELTDYVQGLKDSVLGTGRSKAQGYTDDLKQRVLGNPLGIALIGAGIGWRLYKHPPITTLLLGTGIALLMRGGGNSAQRHFHRYHDPYNPEHPGAYVPGGVAGYGYPVEEEAPGASLTDRAGIAAGSAASRTSEMARDLSGRARETAADLGERVSDTVDSTRTLAASAADNARTAVGDAAESARTAVLHAAETARTTVSEAAANVRTAVSDMAERTGSTVSHGADYARRRAAGLAEQAQTRPVLLGALGLALGTAIVYSLRASTAGEWETSGRGRGPNRRGAERGEYRGARTARSSPGAGPRRRGRPARDMASAAGEGIGDAASRAGEAVGDMASSAAEAASGVADAAGRVLGAAGETISSTASSAYDAASSAYRSAAGYGRRAPEAAGRVGQQLAELGERYPLLLGAVSLAVGAAVGGSLRLSESENRVMGPMSDMLKQRARELADEQFGMAREAAEQFAGDLSSQFGAGQRQEPGQDTSADFETVIGGGQPEAATTTGPDGGRRPPTPSL